MRHGSILLVCVASAALAACSGGAGNSASNASNSSNTAGNSSANGAATASFDPNSEQGRAYRAVVECAGTYEAAGSLIGAVSMQKTGAEQTQYRDEENRRKAHSRALKAHAVELGAAMGVTSAQVDEQVGAHAATFVHSSSSGTMDQYAGTVSAQANSCGANYPQIVR